jgi:RNA polymerase sigma-70 factor (ECF subfamily)
MSGIDLGAFSSEELATRFAETRENACFAEIERRHKRKVWATAYAVLGDVGKAEDVSQETFLLLSRAGDRFRDGSVEGWLSLVARRLALNLHKHHLRREMVEERFVTETPPGSLTADQPDLRILETLATLPPEQRVCLNLLYGEGLSYKEIVEKTGFSLKEVKTHVQNGRRNFKLRWDKGRHNGK